MGSGNLLQNTRTNLTSLIDAPVSGIINLNDSVGGDSENQDFSMGENDLNTGAIDLPSSGGVVDDSMIHSGATLDTNSNPISTGLEVPATEKDLIYNDLKNPVNIIIIVGVALSVFILMKKRKK